MPFPAYPKFIGRHWRSLTLCYALRIVNSDITSQSWCENQCLPSHECIARMSVQRTRVDCRALRTCHRCVPLTM